MGVGQRGGGGGGFIIFRRQREGGFDLRVFVSVCGAVAFRVRTWGVV